MLDLEWSKDDDTKTFLLNDRDQFLFLFYQSVSFPRKMVAVKKISA